jgi:hypothetical protein
MPLRNTQIIQQQKQDEAYMSPYESEREREQTERVNTWREKKIILLLFYKDLFFRYQHYALEVRATSSTVNECPPWLRLIYNISTLLQQIGDIRV